MSLFWSQVWVIIENKGVYLESVSSCVNSGVRVQFGGETSMQIDLHVNLEKLEHEHWAENSPPFISTVDAYTTVPLC